VRPVCQGLQEAGYIEGRNITIEYRWSEAGADSPTVVADLVRKRCAVIIAGGNAPMAAARTATQTIPIIFVSGEDPKDTPIKVRVRQSSAMAMA